jgi:hypothetical protein
MLLLAAAGLSPASFQSSSATPSLNNPISIKKSQTLPSRYRATAPGEERVYFFPYFPTIDIIFPCWMIGRWKSDYRCTIVDLWTERISTDGTVCECSSGTIRESCVFIFSEHAA